VAEFDGKFPENYDALLSLKGVGPYTAAAIASFAFGLPHAVVDGNVFRVLARVHDIDTPIDSTEGKQQFSALAEELLDKKEAGSYNQAIMDFGATVCKPLLPLCHDCPLKKICKAHHRGRASILPVKEKVLQKKKRWFYYFLLEVDGRILVRERTAKDIWQNLFEFYLLETPSEIEWDNQSMEEWLLQQFDMKPMKAPLVSEVYSQQLTHQLIKGQFIYVQLKKIPTNLEHATWQPNKKLNKLAFPKFIRQYLDTKYIQIGLF
jgi:A/G-specific adenine glycosylase